MSTQRSDGQFWRAFGHSKRALTNRQTGTVWGRKLMLPAPPIRFSKDTAATDELQVLSILS